MIIHILNYRRKCRSDTPPDKSESLPHISDTSDLWLPFRWEGTS